MEFLYLDKLIALLYLSIFSRDKYIDLSIFPLVIKSFATDYFSEIAPRMFVVGGV